ncbi:Hypothetical protein CM240_2758 [Clostridium bornimense]|uniref:FTP domain-containing protein n=1 Tax=Clostridium bornimense TaxID=1216932 RepID=W6SJI7_9CLOT|nr:hypothetical protein [Clostridium bornimense]CDM69875.1 Hypothetical protein CM240_2758 [Clostridium bornimense]
MVIDGLVLIILIVGISLFIYNKNSTGEEQKKRYTTYDFNDLENIKSYDIDYLKILNDNKNPTIYYNEDGSVKAIYGKYTDMTINNGKDAIHSLYNIKDLMGISDPAKEFIVDKETKQEGQVIYRLQQIHNGYLVYSNQIIVTVNEKGQATSISGKYTPLSNISFNNKINKKEGIKVAKKYSSSGIGTKYQGEKVVYIQRDNSAKVAWMIRYTNIRNTTKDKVMFIDAENGKLISEVPLAVN